MTVMVIYLLYAICLQDILRNLLLLLPHNTVFDETKWDCAAVEASYIWIPLCFCVVHFDSFTAE